MPKNLVYSDETINKYLKKNKLQDSYIPARLLFQVRNTLPMRKIVGNINGTGKLFFEETEGSLKNRHYKYNGKGEPSSWNLLYDEGFGASLITKEEFYKIKDKIIITNNTNIITLDFLENFVNTVTKRKNPFTWKPSENKQRNIYVTDEEFKYVKIFIKKMRERRNEE